MDDSNPYAPPETLECAKPKEAAELDLKARLFKHAFGISVFFALGYGSAMIFATWLMASVVEAEPSAAIQPANGPWPALLINVALGGAIAAVVVSLPFAIWYTLRTRQLHAVPKRRIGPPIIFGFIHSGVLAVMPVLKFLGPWSYAALTFALLAGLPVIFAEICFQYSRCLTVPRDDDISAF